MSSLLKVNQLGRSIADQWLWRQVSFELKSGDQLGVYGPSGIGKSLLMRSLVGLDLLDEGEVFFLDRPISSWDKPTLRRQIIYLAQSPGILEGTVEENLKAIFDLKGFRDRRYDSEAVHALFAQLGKGEAFLSQSTRRLSGGEKQMVGLVRALQMQPKVLLLDEPTSALDPDTTQKVETILSSWMNDQKEIDRAYIWISHSPQQIQRVTNQQLNLGEFASSSRSRT